MNKIVDDENIDKYKMLSILRDCGNPMIDDKYQINIIIEQDITNFIDFFEKFVNGHFKIKIILQKCVLFDTNHKGGDGVSEGVVADFEIDNLDDSNINNNIRTILTDIDKIKSNLKKHLNDKRFNFDFGNIDEINFYDSLTLSLSGFQDSLQELKQNIEDFYPYDIGDYISIEYSMHGDTIIIEIDKVIECGKQLNSKKEDFLSQEENKTIYSYVINFYFYDEDIENYNNNIKDMKEHISKNIMPGKEAEI